MKKTVAFLVVASLLAEPALAGSFGIDFSPLHEPGFGKRRDYGVDPPANGSSGGDSARPARPRGPSEAMKRLGRELESARRQLSRDIIELPEARTGLSAGLTYERQETEVGDMLFNVREADVMTFLTLPDDYTPPPRASGDGLRAATLLMRFAASDELDCGDAEILAADDPSTVTCETSAFLADQAALAMIGAPLRVRLEEEPPDVTGEERAAVDAALANVSLALSLFRNAHAERRAAEVVTLANPIDLVNIESEERMRFKEEAAERYDAAIRAERLAGEQLFGAQRELRDAVKRAGGG